MLAYTYMERGRFALLDKPKPVLRDPRDAIVRVTLSSICTSDLHIKHGSVPRAVPGVTVGHEMVGVVEQVGSAVYEGFLQSYDQELGMRSYGACVDLLVEKYLPLAQQGA